MADYRPATHHRVIASRLLDIERGRAHRLIITMPPRHGKSELASVRFPAWYLGRNPDRRIILASYADTLAQTFSRQVRNLIKEDVFQAIFPGVRLASDSAAVNDWALDGRRGGMRAAGVGSGITGRGADLLIIDDPIKDAQAADSETIREATWEWYTRTAYTRLSPGGAVVVIGTRWHEDDLIGRLLAANTGEWETLHLPAIDATGAALWPERYDVATLAQIQAAIGERAWQSLYQGRPIAETGGIFDRADFTVVDEAPAGGRQCRFWDFAATARKMSGDPDYTVGLLMRLVGGRYYILDVVRRQENPAEIDRIVAAVAAQDGRETAVRWEMEGGASGKRDSAHLARMLVGYDCRGVRPQGDKVLRSKRLASQAKAGLVCVMRAAWNRAYLDEVTAFPYAAHDDQVDASSGAFDELAVGPGRGTPRSYQG